MCVGLMLEDMCVCPSCADIIIGCVYVYVFLILTSSYGVCVPVCWTCADVIGRCVSVRACPCLLDPLVLTLSEGVCMCVCPSIGYHTVCVYVCVYACVCVCVCVCPCLWDLW